MTIRATTPQEFNWVWEKLGYKVPGPFVGITYEKNDKIQAIALYYHLTANDVEMALVAEDMSRKFLKEMFRFASESLKISRVTLKMPEGRDDLVSLYKRLGAEFEGRQKFFYSDGTDALLYRFDHENYRYK